MKKILLLSALLFSFESVKAQINKPRSSVPTTTTTQTAPKEAEPTPQPTQTGGVIAIKEVANTEIKLRKVEGNTTDQTVTFHFLLTNRKANANIRLRGGQAVDEEGDEYNRSNYYDIEPLFTDVPTKGFIILSKVPPSVKQLRIMKVVFWRADIGDTQIEFRNLTIDWK